MSTLTTLLQEQTVLVEEIFQLKSAINNITLQLDREDPDDEDKKQWRAGAKYSRAMKEAELERLESKLEGMKSAIRSIESGTADRSAQGNMVAQEFMQAAKRRLQSDVYVSILTEAEEVSQDALFDAAGTNHNV